MLKFENITVCHGNHTVFSEIDFCLRPHRLTAVLGKNGCGKSTLVSCITGQVRYTGDILLSDRPLRFMSHRARAEQIAVLPQLLQPVPLTVYQLVSLGRNPYLDFAGRLSHTDRIRIEEAIALTGIEELRNKRADLLSGGELRKAYLAMILAQNTRIVVLDEPDAYLDMENETELVKILNKLKTLHKKTLMVVMHDLTRAAEISDDILIIDGGKKNFYGSREECLKTGAIENCFNVRRTTYEKDGGLFPIFY